ncbi:MAG: nuclear transport factor 2 family protein [Gemmatimonadales bacterium]|nr:nuclear transport factor 2 family protein [Gemmatimonadota bacterium]MDX2056964.1 nuclear transport factor 2 family protein [Gemmatimonadales bacterium]
MTVTEVATGLSALVARGEYHAAMNAYYHPDIVSIEAAGEPREVVGIEACRQKAQWWVDSFEVHSATVEGPFVGEGRFVVRYLYDVTNRSLGTRSLFDELALYWVEGGKVVKEQFFYHMPGM